MKVAELVAAERARQRVLAVLSMPPVMLRVLPHFAVAAPRNGRAAGAPTVRLPDGTIGYYARPGRTDDCWAAAVATCLQVPIDKVPDPAIDERLSAGEDSEVVAQSMWREFAQWLDDRDLTMTFHPRPPVWRKRWIGLVEFPGAFANHSLVMQRDQVLFDPINQEFYSRAVRRCAAESVTLGYSFRAIRPRARF